eukprot:g1016.t1
MLTGPSAFRKTGNWLFFPTYLEETYSWSHACSELDRQNCLNMSKLEDTGRRQNGFAARGEEILVIIHEYAMPQVSLYVPFFGLPDWGSVLTVLLQPDGSRCEVRGKSQFTAEEAASGIGASVRDWMRCAGSDLDQDPMTFARHESSNLAKHLRSWQIARWRRALRVQLLAVGRRHRLST